ncbi:hypothetical protein QTI05_24270 [Variovorax sp. J22R193]|uniref:hypothetical protein n=1 Tax=Variovorax fucosicus TaxID=3053517 RepID=UPI00257633B9|nr:hypothetical protein [Variovorax sp. J22R193]MDM0042176.1 hypothetical protein [Variovorax sp. J22R193]
MNPSLQQHLDHMLSDARTCFDFERAEVYMHPDGRLHIRLLDAAGNYVGEVNAMPAA